MKQLGLEEGKRVFESIGLGARNGSFDRSRIQTLGDQIGDEEVDCILQSTLVVSRVLEQKHFSLRSVGCRLLFFLLNLNAVLLLHLDESVSLELVGVQVLFELFISSEDQLVGVMNHALSKM